MNFYQQLCRRFSDYLQSPQKIIFSLVLLGLAISVIMLFVPVFYRDSVSYIAFAKALQLKNWSMAFDLTIIPGVPVLGGLLMSLGFNEMQGVTLVSSLFGIALIFPCYGVFASYLDEKRAAWGTALFFLIPQNVEASFAPLMDSARWFFFFLSWYLILQIVRRRSRWNLVFLGCSYAGFALVRSEGIVFTVLFSVFFLFELLRAAEWKVTWKTIWSNLLLVLLPLLIMTVLLLPRIIQCWIYTGYPALDMRQTWAVRGILNNFFPLSDQMGVQNYGSVKDFNGGWIMQGAFHRRFWNNVFTGCFIPYLLLAGYGGYLIFKRKRWQYVHTLFLFFLCTNALIFFAMRSNAGRYFYVHAFFIMPFALYGLEEIIKDCKRFPVSKYVFLPVSAILVGIFLYRGTSNFRYSDMMQYPVLGKYMEEYSKAGSRRSGLKHPVYLVIGKNYGWGYSCKGNEIFYSERFHLRQRYSVREILLDGVPAECCNYAVEPLAKNIVLKPDYVIVEKNKDPEIFQGCQAFLLEIKQTRFKNVKLYQVVVGESFHE